MKKQNALITLVGLISSAAIAATPTASTKAATKVSAKAATKASANAAKTAAVAQSSASAAQVAPSLRERISVSSYALLWGPALSSISPGQSNTKIGEVPDETGAPAGALNIDGQVKVAYKLNSSWKAAMAADLNYVPIMGHDITLLDPSVSISNGKLLSAANGNFTVSSDLRAYAPTSTGSQAKNQITQLRTNNSFKFQIPNSRWSLGVDTTLRAYLFSTGAKDGDSRSSFRAYAGPNISYQISPKLSAGFLLEGELAHRLGTRGLSPKGSMDFEPGLSWDVTDNVNVTPFLNLYPTEGVNMRNTTLNVLVAARLL